MTSTLLASVQHEGNREAGASELACPISDARWTPYRLKLTRDVAGQLGRYVSPIVATLRTAFEARVEKQGSDDADELIIDLSDASTVPCAQLIFLVNLLRRTLGNGVVITLSGVTPMISGGLVGFDLPGNVVVIDSRRRRWTT